MGKKIDYNLIKNDYIPDDWMDDDFMYAIKEAINSLTPMERRIWLTYTETGSYAATGREFNVSAPTSGSYVRQVKIKILKLVLENDNIKEGVQYRVLQEIENEERRQEKRKSK